MEKTPQKINRYTAWKKREQWFIQRIGKKVFRGPVSCNCNSCDKGHKDGIVIIDHEHAIYLQSVESETNIRYTDKQLQS